MVLSRWRYATINEGAAAGGSSAHNSADVVHLPSSMWVETVAVVVREGGVRTPTAYARKSKPERTIQTQSIRVGPHDNSFQLNSPRSMSNARLACGDLVLDGSGGATY